MVARFDLGHVTPDVTITLHEQQSRWRRG